MGKEKFISELYNESFVESSAMRATLAEMEEDSQWIRTETKQIVVSPVENFPIMATDIAKELGCDAEALQDTMMRGTCLAIKFNGMIYPVRGTAIKSMLDRAGVHGDTISMFNPDEMSQLFGLCYPKVKGYSSVLIRGRKATAVMSDNGGGYKYLSMLDLMSSTEKMLNERFGDKAEFINGWVSHDFMIARYAINEPKLLEAYETLTQDSPYGANFTPQLVIYTSDIGTCSAKIVPSFMTSRGATIRICDDLYVKHRKSATLAEFEEKLNETFAKYVDFATCLGKMAEVVIPEPCKAFMLAAKKAGVSIRLAKKALNDFQMYVGDGEATAHDIYLGLCEVLFYAKAEGKDEKALCSVEETVSRCLAFDWANWKSWENEEKK